ncbi:hypothetical protein GCM10023322_82560 [Rugosimonospora acidiphila]|uniref:Uncharacterized protein n=1 Tax=Rugosimonospora acidiphila TaxID=556531 RepID=A0ABP9SSC7_9ACTN
MTVCAPAAGGSVAGPAGGGIVRPCTPGLLRATGYGSRCACAAACMIAVIWELVSRPAFPKATVAASTVLTN